MADKDLPSYDELMQQNQTDSNGTPSYEELMDPLSHPKSNLGRDIGDTAKGLGQGAAFGLGDEILGGLQAARDKVAGSDEDLTKLYRTHQKENEEEWKQAKERSPYLTGGGELVGSIASPVTGALGLTKGGLKAAQMMLRAGAGGAIAGIGGSEGTIENPTEIGKDAFKGAALGAGTAGLASGLGKMAGKLGDIAEDSTLGQKLKYLYNKAKGGETFSGEKAGTDIQNEVEGIRNSVTKQVMDPLKNTSNLYGQTLKDASDNGAKIEFNPDLAKKFAAAKRIILGNSEEELNNPVNQQRIKNSLNSETMEYSPQLKEEIKQVYNPETVSQDTVKSYSTVKDGPQPNFNTPDNKIEGRGGLTPELESLLQKYGKTIFDPETVSQKTLSLNPEEAKQLQLGLRDLLKKGAYKDTEVIGDLEKALTPAIDSALPEGQLSKLNDTFSRSRQSVEPFLNKGEADELFQKTNVSDVDPEALAPKVSTFLDKLMSDLKEGNISGDEARAALKNITGKIKTLNETSQTQFIDPNQIEKQLTEGGFKTGIRRGIVGTKTADQIHLTDKLGNMITGSPYKATEFAGKVAKGINDTGIIGTNKTLGEVGSSVSKMGRNLFQAGDEQLSAVAGKLKNTPGLQHMGGALEDAIANKNTAARNAALFTIMQNPKARESLDYEKDLEKP